MIEVGINRRDVVRMKRQFRSSDGHIYQRESRWLKIKHKLITKRHSLWDYADTYGIDNENEGILSYFIKDKKQYALGQFAKLSYPIFFEEENGKKSFLSGYDYTLWYNPYLIEINDTCEAVRLYTLVPND